MKYILEYNSNNIEREFLKFILNNDFIIDQFKNNKKNQTETIGDIMDTACLLYETKHIDFNQLTEDHTENINPNRLEEMKNIYKEEFANKDISYFILLYNHLVDSITNPDLNFFVYYNGEFKRVNDKQKNYLLFLEHEAEMYITENKPIKEYNYEDWNKTYYKTMNYMKKLNT